MMQNTSITLYQWPLDNYPDEYLDIDWPAVHKECGVDQIEWLNKQPQENCQLSLEFFQGGKRLIVEFYNDQTLATYGMMFAN